jgi:hypothetical protein
MAKFYANEAPDKTLRQAADLILKRALEVKVPAAKDRALELARLVLNGAPEFGEREMRDLQIVQVLEAEQIGAATFRKALSAARREIVKKPDRPARAKKAPPPGDSGLASAPEPSTTHRAENNAVAATLPRQLL